MAKIALDLTQFKSAGVYTVEIDNSERIIVTSQALRLVPGFSMQGPFNTPVFIKSNRDLEKFYGPRDTKLERKGSFFHRAIQTCLLTSPVVAINLLKPDETAATGDKIQFVGLGLDASTRDAHLLDSSLYTDFYVNFFNRERFWTPDPEYLQGVVINRYADVSAAYDAPLLQFVNTSTKNYSVLIRKAPSSLLQYNVFAIDWFGSQANIPYEWIRPFDYVKDYFIQVVVVEGDWTNYSRLSTDPYYSNFFNADGIKADQLNNFINASNVNLIGSWTGTIIPDFYDKTGANQYIEEIINANVALTGFLVNVNQQAFDQLVWDETQSQWEIGQTGEIAPYQVDLVGHNLVSRDASNDVHLKFLSYDISVAGTIMHDTVAITAYPIGDTTGRSFRIDASADYNVITVGSLIQKTTAVGIIPGVTYVTEKLWVDSSWGYNITTAEEVTAGDVIIQKPIDDASITSEYKFIKIDGFAIKNKHLPGFNTLGAGNAEAGVSKIYSMLEDQGINRGLTNTDMLFYRYIVDTMAYGLQAGLGGKSYLSRLAKARGKCTAILNAPSISQFATSTDPYFCDAFTPGVDPNPVLNTDWIAQGGNPDMQRTFRFTFPDEENGSKYCGVFGPYLKYNDGGKVTIVPPAADVANTYVKKFLGGNPYAIVANRNGIISNPNVLGIEYMIDKQDRDSLEPFGYNSIIERAATGQVMIYSNATAYQVVKSDFNNLHVRELLNTIEIQVDEVLVQYVFDFNSAVTRLNIVNSITPILETIKDAGALIKYEVVMDETNNPTELIAEGFGIIDINVWVQGALTKIVNRITLNKDYGISSGGFVF